MGIGAKRPPSLKSFTHILHWRKLSTVIPYLNIHYVTHPLSCADLSIFLGKSAIFVVSGNASVDCILIHAI